ncbi:MAG: acetate--CoA ligase family protein [Azospirillaceae bacterium]
MNAPPLSSAIFSPRGVALIGASGDSGKSTSRPQRYLRRFGFEGAVYPVNPGRPEVLGERAYRHLSEIDGPIDHAFIMVPSAAVADAVRQCVERQVPVATVFSDGFADSGAEGAALQAKIVEMARAGGVRLLGPNSMGLLDLNSRLALTVSAVFDGLDVLPGGIGLVSQSGSLIGALLTRALPRRLGFSRLVSMGNEADLSVGEMIDALVDDPATTTILLFLEVLRDADRIGAAARRAYASGKPVVALRLGRSDAGRQLAASHTGALAGTAINVSAFFRDHGIIEVQVLESLFEIAPMLSGRRPPAGRRVAVVTPTGGGAATVVDRLGEHDVQFAAAPASLQNSLAGFGLRAPDGPIIDLTVAGVRSDVLECAVDAVTTPEVCDLAVVVAGSSARHFPDVAVRPILPFADRPTPIAVFVVPEAEEALAILGGHGMAGFRTPESCAEAVRAYLNWRPPRERIATPPASADTLLEMLSEPAIDEAGGLAIAKRLGIPVVDHQRIAVASDTVDLRYPLVVKILSPDIPHKSEIGGVRTGIKDARELESAAADILAVVRERRPDAKVGGLLVQEMVHGLAELIIGYRDDPEVGPIALVGMGGIAAEVYADVAVALAPVDRRTAREMLDAIRGMAVLRGFRGRPEGDLDAVADALSRLSQLANLPGRPVAEAELNPVIVGAKGDGLHAVDALIRVHRPRSSRDRAHGHSGKEVLLSAR